MSKKFTKEIIKYCNVNSIEDIDIETYFWFIYFKGK